MRTLTRAKLYPYELTIFRRHSKKGLILEISDESGRKGYGDISPLSGWSFESFPEAQKAAEKLVATLEEGRPVEGFLPPSVSFAYQSALASLENPPKAPIDFSVPYLVTGGEITLSEMTEIKGERIKLKLGSLSLKQAIDLTEELVALGCKIAIDVNRKWELAKSVDFFSRFAKDTFLYVEEPCYLFTDLERFYQKTGIYYAVDESLRAQPLSVLQKMEGLGYIVLKPTLIGGDQECKNLIESLPSAKAIFSSSYESSVGLMHIARLSAKYSPEMPVGIGTFRMTKPLKELLSIDFTSGQLMPELFGRTQFRFSGGLPSSRIC